MKQVVTKEKRFQDYLEFLNRDTKIELEYYLNRLKGKRVAMVNATSYGGGVAEILHSLIPLANDMGLKIDWWAMEGAEEFFFFTKKMHNCLQGQDSCFEEKDKTVYWKYNRANNEIARENYDFIVIHDPQPAGLIEHKKKSSAKWIWRCHIDTSAPNRDYWDFLYRLIKKYDSCIFTMEEFVYEKSGLQNLAFITPSIDPLSVKNIALDKQKAFEVISRFGVDTKRPLISQISRFDPWKDPLGVIDAYKIVKKEFPSVQLALVGSMASDDPEGWDYLYHTLRRAGEDYDIKVITNFNGVSDYEVNAFQTASQVLLQKSIREGFGLTVAEGMWKGTPVIGGNAGGIKLQIEDGKNGYLVNTVEECAEKILTLIRNPFLGAGMGESAKEKVRKHFLITGHILNYLKLFDSLS